MGDALKEEQTGQERIQDLTVGTLVLNPNLHVTALVTLEIGYLNTLGLCGIISVMRVVYCRDA